MFYILILVFVVLPATAGCVGFTGFFKKMTVRSKKQIALFYTILLVSLLVIDGIYNLGGLDKVLDTFSKSEKEKYFTVIEGKYTGHIIRAGSEPQTLRLFVTSLQTENLFKLELRGETSKIYTGRYDVKMRHIKMEDGRLLEVKEIGNRTYITSKFKTQEIWRFHGQQKY